jgi:amino acid transporter
LTYVLAVFLMTGAMVLVILAIIGALKTGVITLGRAVKVGRQSSPLVYWLVISISVGVVVLSAVDLVRLRTH